LRIFATSDLHVDYRANREWLWGISNHDYQDDVIIVAGDISDIPSQVDAAFIALKQKFREVLFVPGNHDIWVKRSGEKDSFRKFEIINHMAADNGVITGPLTVNDTAIIPIHGWYDYSFGAPDAILEGSWMDYSMCRWPCPMDDQDINSRFSLMNDGLDAGGASEIITYSHYLPRIDIMPEYIPPSKRFIYPVLGSVTIEETVRAMGPIIHVYGHSHVNRQVEIDGIKYINNALGYPHETRISSRMLLKIHET